jgi:hypothetical protein
MKKVIFGISFLVIAGASILVACNKQNLNLNQSNTVKTEQTPSVEKLGGLSDADLINIIHGSDPSYPTLEDIELVLLDNCKLSSSVVRAMIAESRIPNYMIETVMVLSAPISSGDLTYLNTVRPTLSTTAIVAAASVDLTNLNYAIVNTSPRQLLFAKNMVKKSLCTDGCGESEMKGQNFIVLDLTSITTPLDPAEMKPCESGGKWVCGTAKRVRLTGTDGTTSTYSVTCTQSAEKCFKDVADAVRDYH